MSDSSRLREVLGMIIPVLKEQGVPYFLTDGSLLGTIRDGDLLPWDTDIDLGVRLEDWNPAVIPAAIEAGFIHGHDLYNKWRYWMRDVIKIPSTPPRVKFDFYEVHVDIAILVPGYGEYADSRFTVYGDLIRVIADTVSSEREVDLQGMSVSVPVDAERYLENQYGPSWRTPNPRFIGSEAHKRVLRRLLVVPSTGISVTERWKGMRDELGFWATWIRNRGGEWAEEFERRLDPDLPVQEYIAAHIQTGQERILDVGAGVLTSIGKLWNGKQLDITPIDCLAHRFDELLTEEGIEPVVRTMFGEVEELSNTFPLGSFDIVHCSNMWDHSFDPLGALIEMTAVTKPGGVIILSNHLDEGINQNYQGQHHWNIGYSDGDLYVQRPGLEYPVSECIDGIELESANVGDHWIIAVMRRYG